MTEQSPNTINGPVTGNSVQAGAIHGGVHFHLNHAAPPEPELEVTFVPPPPLPPKVRQGPRKRVLAAKFLGRWFLALLPVLLISSIVGGVGNQVTGFGPLPLRLLADLGLLLFVVLALWVWSMAATRRFRDLVTLVLDKITSHRIMSLTKVQLTVFTWTAAAMCVGGLIRESLPPDPTRPPVDGHMAVVFCGLLSLLLLRQLRRRNSESHPVA
ncbi:hypothetical protein [Crossiella cryophila]|uniref:Uncharacterized protein n=1 Tax=Crossiella cryophila TaxID=43355 RepID=A0A7W7FTK4_9PSEU|nr:hypothetical protein [Crossiella cryophila]MBB4677090.1 hypothetical protein [Crossiella cryophila]